MEVRHLLLAFVLLTHGLTTLMWWAAGTWLGLSRKAAMHWLGAGLSNGLPLAFMVFNEGWPQGPFRLLARLDPTRRELRERSRLRRPGPAAGHRRSVPHDLGKTLRQPPA